MVTQLQKDKFTKWWNNQNTGRPLVNLRVAKESAVYDNIEYDNPEEMYCNVDKLVHNAKQYIKNTEFMCEAFPSIDLNLGAGSFALYIGSEPHFTKETVWFKEIGGAGLETLDIKFDKDNYWFNRHMEMIRHAKDISEGMFDVTIPDIIENMDVLASLRGAQDLCYDLFDEPELIEEKIKALDDIYMNYYNAFYDIAKLDDDSSIYTAFCIWGPKKSAKIQCDFNALMSPSQFNQIVVPSLTRQCDTLDYTMFHLDGKEAAIHADALASIKNLNAVQWTHGDGNPDCFDEKWFDMIYDKIAASGKSLHLHTGVADADYIIRGIDKLVQRYGTKGLFFNLPTLPQKQADILLNYFAKTF